MPEPITFDAPVVGGSSLPTVDVRDAKWQRERLAFYRMLPDLLAAHRNRYVAVHEERVAGVGDELIAVAKEAYTRYGYLPIYIGLVTDPSPRRIRMPHGDGSTTIQ